MHKKSLKIKESDRWNKTYLNLIKKLKEDFVEFIPYSKQRRKILRDAEQIDWGRIVHLFESEINDLEKKLEIPDRKERLLEVSPLNKVNILEFLKHQLYYIFFFYMNEIEEEDDDDFKKEELINEMLGRVESEIKLIMGVLKVQVGLSSLKWIEDSETSQTIINDLKDKYYGRPYGRENLKLYGKILKNNDEYIKKYKKSNYRTVTKNVTKLWGNKFDNFYKAFDKFKERNNIRTYKDFKNSIYYSKVDKSSPSA